MYYAETIIDGILCYKTTPDGRWKQFTLEQLTQRISDMQGAINALQDR